MKTERKSMISLSFFCRMAYIPALLLGTMSAASALPPVLNSKELTSCPPKIIRTCCLFGAEVKFAGIPLLNKTDIVRLDQIGQHAYLGGPTEDNGIIYTRKGGFIDTGHLRDCADWTAYLFAFISNNVGTGEEALLHLGKEGGDKQLILHIGKGITRNNAAALSARIAYDLSLWHEIATWFGASYVPMIPEGYSSFSPEDLYSNLLGTLIGIQAIESDMEYNTAMNYFTLKMLRDLDAVTTAEETLAAMNKTESLWWSAEKRLPGKNVLIQRYFDIETSLVPWLVPQEDMNFVPHKLEKMPVELNELFSFRIDLNYKFPHKNFIPLSGDKSITQRDFPAIVDWIEQDALAIRNNTRLRKDVKGEKEAKTLLRRQERVRKI